MTRRTSPKRGSEQSPFIVKVLPTLNTKQEAANQTKESKQRASLERRTLLVGIITAIVLAFLRQTDLKTSARPRPMTIEVGFA
jgi:hypothetical protein